MRIAPTLSLVSLVTLLAAGCAGPEQKLGRGVLDATEFVRLGEWRRTVEQTALFDGPDTAYTTGVIRGFNRSVFRTVLGAAEIATFPIPPYGPWLAPDNFITPDVTLRDRTYPYGLPYITGSSIYPASYAPGLMDDSTFNTDTSLGFSGGEIVPFVPGSRFKIFDN